MLKLKDGYYAKDKDGTIYAYKEKPIKFNIEWATNSQIDHVNNIEITESWEDSLYHVKDGVATKVVTFVKDQKVLVRDSEADLWTRRYYSHEEEEGKYYVFYK